MHWKCSNFKREDEGQEYAAATFTLNNKSIIFRVGKITPTKIGQFVTVWKRSEKGPIVPHDISDNFDLLVIGVRNGEKFGQFVFPKHVLLEKGIISHGGKGGKLGIRIYPRWDTAENVQAKKTQLWQLNYFFEINAHEGFDKKRVTQVYAF